MPILRPVKRKFFFSFFLSLHQPNNRAENISLYLPLINSGIGKDKGKVHPRTGHKGPEGA